MKSLRKTGLLFAICLLCLAPRAHTGELGLFDAESDVGHPARAGTAVFDSTTQSFLVTGGGANMWSTNDAFHFAWKKMSGDFALEAAIQFLRSGGNAHRKACLMIRQDLSPGSAYVDVAVHGDGLTSLQYRERAGAVTREVQTKISRPARVGLERQGETFSLTIATEAAALEPTGLFVRVKLPDQVYVGLAVCAHDDQALEPARFSDVKLVARKIRANDKPTLH